MLTPWLNDGGMISVEDWAEIRRLSRSEGVPIKGIVRRLGVSRNTVRQALRSDELPVYRRARSGSALDGFMPAIRACLDADCRMPATVIAQRVGWPGGLTVLKDRLRLVRPEYVGVDPVGKVVYEPGGVSQWDLWFPDVLIPVGSGQEVKLPVLVTASGFSRRRASLMIPSRTAGDILGGMWELIRAAGGVTKTIVWDR
jgi:transposase